MTDYRLPINYLDTGRIARDKINDSFNEVVERVIGYRPHIENGIWWIGNTNTGVKAKGDAVDMKVEEGYIWYKSDSQQQRTQIIAIEDLKGEKGDKGDKGDTGAKGETGPQGPQGVQGIQGIPGEAFEIYKTYSSIAAMEADKDNVPEGKFVLITSTVEDPDNAKLYVKGASDFAFLTDMSGATGIQGEQGPQGVQGDQGIQGETGASIVSAAFSGNDIVFTKDDSDTVTLENAKTTLKGDKGDKGDQGNPGTDAWEYMTQQQYDALPSSKLTDGVSRMVYSDEERFFKTALRAANNLLHYNQQDELYADLQLENGMTTTDSFPIGVNVGNVSSTDGRPQSGLLVNALATSGNYMRRLYGNDGKLYFDGGSGVFKTIATTDDITSAVGNLRNDLATVALTGKSSDLNNDAEFTADKVMTMEEYEQLPGTAGDDKNYRIFEEEN